MKKLLFLLLLLPSLLKAQVPALQDTVISGASSPLTPTYRYQTTSFGVLTYRYNPVLGKYALEIDSKYLRAYYAPAVAGGYLPLSGGTISGSLYITGNQYMTGNIFSNDSSPYLSRTANDARYAPFNAAGYVPYTGATVNFVTTHDITTANLTVNGPNLTLPQINTVNGGMYYGAYDGVPGDSRLLQSSTLIFNQTNNTLNGAANYSANYTANSYVQKAFTDASYAPITSGGYLKTDGSNAAATVDLGSANFKTTGTVDIGRGIGASNPINLHGQVVADFAIDAAGPIRTSNTAGFAASNGGITLFSAGTGNIIENIVPTTTTPLYIYGGITTGAGNAFAHVSAASLNTFLGISPNSYELLSNKVTTLDNSTNNYPTTSAVTAALASYPKTTLTGLATGDILAYDATSGTWKNRVNTVTAPLIYSAGNYSITQSGASTNGYLSSTDWNTFNNAVTGLSTNYISTNTTQTGLTGDKTSTGNYTLGGVIIPSTTSFNFAYRGQIAAATGKWNAYMDGTASNFFAGTVSIGGANNTTAPFYLTLAGISSSNVTRGAFWQQTLAAAANNSIQVGLDLQPTFTNPGTGVLTFGAITPGSGYANGTYSNVPLTGGSGTGALATITVAGGVVLLVQIGTNGTGYAAGNSLSAAASFDGVGSGSGFSVLVATVGYLNVANYALRIIGTNAGFLTQGPIYQGTSSNGANMSINRGITGSSAGFGVLVGAQFQSDVTSAGAGFATNLGTQATSFTLGQIYHYQAQQQPFGAGSTVNVQTGFYVTPGLTGALTNYGFRGAIPSGTGRWNLYIDGTAQNAIVGLTRFGSLAVPINTVDVTGTMGVTGHVTFEGVTSTGATGTGNFVYSISPALTGIPTVPTAAALTSTGQAASTAFVTTAISAIPARTPASVTSSITMQLNFDYLNPSATQNTLTLPSCSVFNTDGSKIITVLATGTGGTKILVPSGYSMQSGSSFATTTGTGGVTLTQGQKVQLIPVNTNSYYLQPLNGTVTLY